MTYRSHFFPSRTATKTFFAFVICNIILTIVLCFVLIYCYTNFISSHTQSSKPWLLFFILACLVYLFCLITITIKAIHSLAVPLDVFTQAAKRLSMNLEAEPIDESGSSENKSAIHAFNMMHAKVQQLMQERGQMMAAISHDIRTPITRMKIRAEHYLEDTMSEKFIADLNEMEQLANKILEYTEKEQHTFKKQQFDLTALIKQLCQQLIDVGHDVYFDTEVEQLLFSGDKNLLKRALANLISNAAIYGNTAHISLSKPNADIIIKIEDQGDGIPKAELEKVFIPFYRLEKSRSQQSGGTGLGLAIARQAITANGGSIKLSNRQQGGLCVTIHLPANNVGTNKDSE